MKILAITPMEEEVNLFVRSCNKRGIETKKSFLGKLPVKKILSLDITLACGGIGKAQFGIQTQYLLDTDLKWDLVICTGVAGALIDELSVGDVVVGEQIIEHDFMSKFSDYPNPKFKCAPKIIKMIKNIDMSNMLFKVFIGILASGDEDIVDSIRREYLREKTKAIAVSWEGAGGARACKFSGVPFIEIRGISDVAKSPSSLIANLENAMDNVVELFMHLFNK